MAGAMLSPPRPQPPPAMARSQSLCLHQSQFLRESHRCRSFPYKSGLDSLNTKESPSRLPLLRVFSDNNSAYFSTYYKEHNQTTGSDDSNPGESLLPSVSPHAYTDYGELGKGPDYSNPTESPLPCNSPHADTDCDKPETVAGIAGSDDSNPRFSSHADTNYGELSHVAIVVVSDDSNLSESLLSVSPHASADYGEPGNQTTTVGPSNSSVVVNVAVENTDFDHPRHGTRLTRLQWIFMVNGLSLEMLSAGFDQLSSPKKSLYALVSLLLAIAAVLACILELIHNGIKEGVESNNCMPFGNLPEMFGLGLAVIQCLCSAEQYYFLHRQISNPMKLSPVPLFFFCCLVVLKLKMN